MHRILPQMTTTPGISSSASEHKKLRHRGTKQRPGCGGRQTLPCKCQTPADLSAVCKESGAGTGRASPGAQRDPHGGAYRCSLPHCSTAGKQRGKREAEEADVGGRGLRREGVPKKRGCLEREEPEDRVLVPIEHTYTHAQTHTAPSPSALAPRHPRCIARHQSEPTYSPTHRETGSEPQRRRAARRPPTPPSPAASPRGASHPPRPRCGSRTVGSSGSICAPWSWVSMRRRGRGGALPAARPPARAPREPLGCAGLRAPPRSLRGSGGAEAGSAHQSHGPAHRQPQCGGRQEPDPPAGCGRIQPPPPAPGGPVKADGPRRCTAAPANQRPSMPVASVPHAGPLLRRALSSPRRQQRSALRVPRGKSGGRDRTANTDLRVTLLQTSRHGLGVTTLRQA